MIIRTKPGAESKKGSAAEGLQELKSAFLKSREQTERLERVIRLCETARAASDRRALGYTALNDTLAAIDYRQAALWWRAADDAGAGRIEGLSGVADPVRNAAFPAWLVKRLGGFADAHPAGASSLPGSALADELVQPFNVLEHPPAADHDRMMAKEFLPAQALWAELPLKAPQAGGSGIRAALILWRDAPWTGADKAILTHLARAYADAWSAMPLGRSDWSGEGTVKAHSGRLLVWSRKRWVRCAAAAAVVGAMLIPIRQSVLAPAEVTAKNPFAVRAPLSGVVEEIVVKPNAPVKAGDLLCGWTRATCAVNWKLQGRRFLLQRPNTGRGSSRPSLMSAARWLWGCLSAVVTRLKLMRLFLPENSNGRRSGQTARVLPSFRILRNGWVGR